MVVVVAVVSLWGELIPRELENTITSVPLSEEYTFSIDPYYAGYNDVVNRINAKLGNYNNGNLDIDWFDVLDILSVQIQHQFVCEERSNYYVFHEKDFYPSIDQDYDKKLYFYDDPCAQMDNSAKCSVTKCSVTNIVAILRDVKWYNSKLKAPIHMRGATSGTLIVLAAQGLSDVEVDDLVDRTTFNGEKYQGKIKGYNHDEDLYHLCAAKLKHKWKQKTTDSFTHFIKKFAPTTSDMYESVISLLVEDIRIIASLFYHGVDLLEDAMLSIMAHICINSLTSQHIICEEQARGYFTRRTLTPSTT